MSDDHSTIDDPALGLFTRATSESSDGVAEAHDWFTGSIDVDGDEIELMLESTAPDGAHHLLPRVRAVIGDLPRIRRVATDAVARAFTQGEPAPHDLDDAASDLVLDAVEAAADGSIVLHFIDECATHFPEGYWPAVHLADDDSVAQVTVES